MSINTQRINLFFDGFDQFIQRDVPNIVAETATEHYHERFLPQHKDWNGQKWAPYGMYAKKKRPEPTRGSLLYRRGWLQQSIKPSHISPTRVTISAGGGRVPYARVHNEGFRGLVRPYQHPNLFGKGPHTVRSHFRYTPQRQFMGHNPILTRTIQTRLISAYKNRRS